ncbi:acyl carrier protein [Stenotrophomonas sp.]|uniref:acyl carrier protein n=1 Tax=Stenotrophomonas sp. TaxID=69392 RepID=UPI0028A5AEF3|nr:acyl carrier protein [Stenotrophomonas sp.]
MPEQPLQYPAHYPPTDRWKRFFIGLRWLGPDLSFFPALKVRQATRSPELLNAWGGGSKQQLAEQVGRIYAEQLHWRSPVFLPDDRMNVVLGGPTFDGTDAFDAWEVVRAVEEEFGVRFPDAFWNKPELTMAQVVTALHDARNLRMGKDA